MRSSARSSCFAFASAIGLPLGIAAGIYLAEFGAGRFASAVRFIADTLTGIPSIIVGIFIYTIVVFPMANFRRSRAAWRSRSS